MNNKIISATSSKTTCSCCKEIAVGIIDDKPFCVDCIDRMGELHACCAVCGEAIPKTIMSEPVASQMKEHNMCFECNFWREHHERGGGLIFKGHHYRIGGSELKGFGGAKWHITFHNGDVIETDNLWSQGEISPPWREALDDNILSLERIEDNYVEEIFGAPDDAPF